MNKKENILIVDDSHESLSFLNDLLNKEGYKTFPADSGELALASLEDNMPDLILLDIQMPGINGFEVCKQIKLKKELADIPIIFLTAATEINDKLEGLRLGAVDYVTKPFQKEELLARLKTHLKLYRYNQLFREQTAEKLIENEKILKEKNEDLEAYNEELKATTEALKENSLELSTSKEKAEESEVKFRTIFENSKDAIGVSKNGINIFFNSAYIKLFGYESQEELIGKPITEQIASRERSKVQEYIQKRSSKLSVPSNYETIGLRKNGAEFHFEIVVNDIILKNENHSVVIIRDISERKKTEEELKKQNEELIITKAKAENSEYQFRNLFEQNPVSLWEEDLSGLKLMVDEKKAEVVDFEQYLDNNSNFISKCASQIVVKNINAISLELFKAKNKKELINNLDQTFNEKSFETFKSLLVAIAEDKTEFTEETEYLRFNGSVISAIIQITLLDNYANSIISITDISKQKKTELQLKRQNKELANSKDKIEESEAKYRTLIDDVLDTSSMGTFILDADFKVAWVNKSMEKYFGLKRENIIGKNKRQLIQSKIKNIFEDSEIFKKKVFATYDNNNYIENFECHVLKGNGREERWLSHWSQPIYEGFYKNGRIEHYYDITELKKAEHKLIKAKEKTEESEKKFRAISEQAVEGITLADKNGNYVFANSAFCNMIGYSEEEILKMTIFEMLESTENVSIDPKFFGIRKEYNLKRNNNSVFPIEITVNPVNIGKESLLLGMVTDIAERKKAEQEIEKQTTELKLSEYYLETAQKIGSIGTWELDLIKNKLIWTEENYKIFGVPLEIELTYEVFLSCIHPDDMEFVNEKWMAALKNKPYDIEHRLLVNNKVKWVREKAEIEFDENGNAIKGLGVTQDITYKKEAEAELVKAKERAEESDRLKTEFINNMSHEIRTPMNGILGFSKMLGKPGKSEEKKKHFVQIIQNSGNQLMRIIDDILEISKLGTKQVTAQNEAICLNDLLLSLFSVFDIKAKENKTPLYLKKGLSDQKSTIFTDESKLNKILSNLLENALKFTNEGFIEFGYSLVEEYGHTSLHENNIQIYVKDTGIGIDPDKQEAIFERFSQAEKELSQKVGGLGLGLSIAKENSELLGGKITLESEKGKGSTFYVTIPYNLVDLDTKNNQINDTKTQSHPITEEYTILIVEDEEVNYLYLETVLIDEIKLDCKILHAKNGQEAIEMCKAESEIRLVLMDLKMPIMNGFEATKQIKKLKPKLPIIAQTAYSTKSEKDEALLAGCDDFISKPIKEETLIEILDKYLMSSLL